MSQAKGPPSQAVEPGPPGALELLYAPWVFLVFAPVLGLSTVTFGSLAVLASLIDERFAHNVGEAWAWWLCRVNFTRVRVEGQHHARPGQSYIIMSNHQSHFDVLAFLGHWRRQFRWVMKEELRKVPGLGKACEATGHIFVDRSNRERAIASLREAQGRLAPGVSVMIFPEGTRSRDGRLGAFKKGGFVMALEMGLPILPVTITGSGKVLPGHSKRLMPGTIRITVHEPIDTTAYGRDQQDRLMEDVRAVIASGLDA